MTTTGMLWLLTVCAVGYALWTVYYFLRDSKSNDANPKPVPNDRTCRKEIIGKSHFVLDQGHFRPKAAVAEEPEKGIGKDHIFAPSISVPEHPRQIPPEELDDVFGDAPAGETNEPLDIYYPLYDEPFPDKEAEPDDEDDTEELPLLGRSLAQGVSFEEMGDAYRHVVHDDPPITNEQKEQTGRVLLSLKETDMFEAIVSGCPNGNDRVKILIDTYLSAFHQRMAAGSAESPSPQGRVPEGFDVRDYV